MGQQQLLLLVLGVVIVGIAVAVGIQAYSANDKKSNLDALTVQAKSIAAEAHAYSQRPDFMQVQDSPGLDDLGYPVDGSGAYVTEHGSCGVSGVGNDITQWQIDCQNSDWGHTVSVLSLPDARVYDDSTAINTGS